MAKEVESATESAETALEVDTAIEEESPLRAVDEAFASEVTAVLTCDCSEAMLSIELSIVNCTADCGL